jgi:hypothetical protein
MHAVCVAIVPSLKSPLHAHQIGHAFMPSQHVPAFACPALPERT